MPVPDAPPIRADRSPALDEPPTFDETPRSRLARYPPAHVRTSGRAARRLPRGGHPELPGSEGGRAGHGATRAAGHSAHGHGAKPRSAALATPLRLAGNAGERDALRHAGGRGNRSPARGPRDAALA